MRSSKDVASSTEDDLRRSKKLSDWRQPDVQLVHLILQLIDRLEPFRIQLWRNAALVDALGLVPAPTLRALGLLAVALSARRTEASRLARLPSQGGGIFNFGLLLTTFELTTFPAL